MDSYLEKMSSIIPLAEKRNQPNRILKFPTHFFRAFEYVNDSVGITDKAGNILYVNVAFESFFGYSKTEVVNMQVNDLFFREDLEKNPFDFSKIQTPGNLILRSRCRKKDGSKIYGEVNISLLENDMYLGVVRDITEQVKLEKELKQNRTLFFNAFDNSPLLKSISILSTGKLIEVNESFCKASGFSKEEAIGKTTLELGWIRSEGRDQLIKEVDQNLAISNLEIPVYKKSGEKMICRSSAYVIKTKEEEKLYVVAEDITELKNLELEIEEAHERYRGLSEATFDSIFLSEKGLCIEQNLSAEKIFGYTNEEAIGRYGTDWVVPEDREMVMNRMLSGYEKPYESTALRKDGSTFPCMLHGKMMFYKGRKVRVTSLRDITEEKNAEAEKFKAYNLLASFSENTTDSIFIKDAQGKYLLFNREAGNVVGKDPKEVIGKDDREIFPLEQAEKLRALDKKILENREVFNYEIILNTPKGKRIHHATKGPLYDNDGELTGIFGISRDITESKIAEENLRVNNFKAEIAIEAAKIAWWEMDMLTGSIAFNSNNAAMLGYPPDKFKHYTDFSNLIHPDDHNKVMDAMRAHLAGSKDKYDVEYRIMTNTGGYKWCHDIGSIYSRDDKGAPEKIMGIVMDITERKIAEKELVKLNSDLRILTNHLSTIREEERSEIAKEIHDELAQNLVALSMNAAHLKNKIKEDSVKQILEEQIGIANNVVHASKTLFNSLHPSMLEELGLEAAIKWYTRTKIKLTQIKFNFYTNANIGATEFTKEINLGLFRIYQENLTNILRHANATNISVEIIKSTDNLFMTITDNGVGFEIDKVDTLNHHGLLGIRERALAIGGEFTIDSAIGKGTTITVAVKI